MESMDHVSSSLDPVNCNHQEDAITKTNLTEKQKLIQRQLLLLLHADKCGSPPNSIENNSDSSENTITRRTCSIPHCSTMKQVLAHLATTCHSPEQQLKSTTSTGGGIKKCLFPYCNSSRLILAHWKQCIMKSHSAALAKAAAAAVTNGSSEAYYCSICEPANKYLLLRHYYGVQQVPEKQILSLKRSSTSNLHDDSQKKANKKFKQAYTNAECTSKIWFGNLTWHKQFKILNSIINDQDTLSCQIFAPNAMYSIDASNFNMKLIPNSILTKLGFSNFGVQPVTFSFNDDESQELKNLLKSNHYSGFIYSNYSASPTKSNVVKFLILQSYDEVCNKFIGWIPLEQKGFVEKLKGIVLEAKGKCFNLEVMQ